METPVTLRTVDRFPEPMFTSLVQWLLHGPERDTVQGRFFQREAASTPTQAQQIRIGAYAGEELIGWSHAYLQAGGVLHVANSAVLPAYRRKGVYTRLMQAVESEALALGCRRVESCHQTISAGVLIAKLKAGYLVVGTEFDAELGLLVRMAKNLASSRQQVLVGRAGTLEAAVELMRNASEGPGPDGAQTAGDSNGAPEYQGEIIRDDQGREVVRFTTPSGVRAIVDTRISREHPDKFERSLRRKMTRGEARRAAEAGAERSRK